MEEDGKCGDGCGCGGEWVSNIHACINVSTLHKRICNRINVLEKKMPLTRSGADYAGWWCESISSMFMLMSGSGGWEKGKRERRAQ